MLNSIFDYLEEELNSKVTFVHSCWDPRVLFILSIHAVQPLCIVHVFVHSHSSVTVYCAHLNI